MVRARACVSLRSCRACAVRRVVAKPHSTFCFSGCGPRLQQHRTHRGSQGRTRPRLYLWQKEAMTPGVRERICLYRIPVSGGNTLLLRETLPRNPAAETAIHPLIWCSGGCSLHMCVFFQGVSLSRYTGTAERQQASAVSSQHMDPIAALAALLAAPALS